MLDVESARALLGARRKVEGRTALMPHPPRCQECERDGRIEEAAVRVESGDSVVLLCLQHFGEAGEGAKEGARVLIPTGGGTPLPVPPEALPAGYGWLITEFQLAVVLPHRLTFIGRSHLRRELVDRHHIQRVLPSSYAPAATVVAQAEFALKYDGLNLEVFAAFFERVDVDAFERELSERIQGQPFGQYSRRLWFVYEWLTGRRLPVPDLTRGSYVDLLDPQEYVTAPSRRVRRQRINDNLLGGRLFSPMVRRTERLASFDSAALARQVKEVVARYDEDALKRAVSYLYTKETRSSFGIEGERPSPNRVERFVGLLRMVSRLPELTKGTLIELQNATVDPRFANGDWRTDQVYVAMAIDLVRQRIEYIAPKHKDVPDLMVGWFECLQRLDAETVDPVVHAAVASFGFVFIHPFNDGNGRLHRLLIHHILSRRGLTPDDFIFPVSAVMEARRSEYDACLESFSRPLMQVLDYDDERGVVSVRGETALHYRYFDATRMVEDLFGWMGQTIASELQQELEFIVRYREARAAMAEVVDLPDRMANLFVQLCRQNGGRLSAAKRTSQFAMLTDEEVTALEEIVRTQLLPASPAAQKEEESGEPPRPPKHTLGARGRPLG